MVESSATSEPGMHNTEARPTVLRQGALVVQMKLQFIKAASHIELTSRSQEPSTLLTSDGPKTLGSWVRI